MHKKLEADLVSLAHSILTMKNRDDVFALKEKSKEVYEKLSMLAFVEEYVNTTPAIKTTKEALIEKVVDAFETKNARVEESPKKEQEAEEKVVYNLIDEPAETNKELVNEVHQNIVTEITEQPFDELEAILFSEDEAPKEVESEPVLENEDVSISEIKTETLDEIIEVKETLESDVVKVETRKTMSLEEELQDIVSVDVMADLFENTQPKSLNDKLAANIQIGLNDRIAFVKNLFNNQQEDYNRVISQLNTFKSERDAKTFITTLVKPDYDWSEQEELEVRFIEIISRRFS